MERRERQKSSLREQKQDLKLISKKNLDQSVYFFISLFILHGEINDSLLPTTDTCPSVMIPQKRCFFFVCCFFSSLVSVVFVGVSFVCHIIFFSAQFLYVILYRRKLLVSYSTSTFEMK